MSESLQTLLARGAGSGVYRLRGRVSARTVARMVETAGWQFLHIDANEVEDKNAFLSVATEALHFPEWAGRNWDAFEELLNDLAWLDRAPGYLLLVDRLGSLARRQPGALRTAIDIIQTAAANHEALQEPPLVVLVRGAGPLSNHLPALTVQHLPRARGAVREHQDA